MFSTVLHDHGGGSETFGGDHAHLEFGDRIGSPDAL
jgi:hypothetical protein